MENTPNQPLLNLGFIVEDPQNLKVLDSPELILSQSHDNETIDYPVAVITTTESNAQFAAPGEMSNLWRYVQTKLTNIYRPLFDNYTNLLLVAVFGVALNFLQVYFLLNIPLARGWRLDIVRRVGENDSQIVPDLFPISIWRYFRKGMVLLIMRGLYFLPHLIFLFISSKQFFFKLSDIINWGYQKYRGNEDETLVHFLLSILPEFAFDLMLQFVVLMLYLIIVWPIYRITAVKYALGQIRGREFLNLGVLKDSIRILTKEAPTVYGIYFFALLIDFVVVAATFFFVTITFGFAVFIMPMFILLLLHWPKGYAYGILARRLIERGYFASSNRQEARESEYPFV